MRRAIHRLICWYLRRFPLQVESDPGPDSFEGIGLTKDEIEVAKGLMEFQNRHFDLTLQSLGYKVP